MESKGDKRQKLQRMLRSIAQESETLRLLRESTEQLREQFNLSDEEIEALKGAEITVSLRSVTFTTGTTFTA